MAKAGTDVVADLESGGNGKSGGML
jgi:hypothetical protein